MFFLLWNNHGHGAKESLVTKLEVKTKTWCSPVSQQTEGPASTPSCCCDSPTDWQQHKTRNASHPNPIPPYSRDSTSNTTSQGCPIAMGAVYGAITMLVHSRHCPRSTPLSLDWLRVLGKESMTAWGLRHRYCSWDCSAPPTPVLGWVGPFRLEHVDGTHFPQPI